MIQSFAISNYRSILNLVTPLEQLNVVTGSNGSGKSNLYRALRLLAETANGGVIRSLANEGGLESAFWAGPEKLSKGMREGTVPVQGGPKSQSVRLKLGFNSEDFGYSISFTMPSFEPLSPSLFNLDPGICCETIWAGSFYRPASSLVERVGPVVKVRSGKQWQVYASHLQNHESILSELVDPENVPEIFRVREIIKSWRFYDYFRTDRHSPIRIPQIGSRTPILDHDGLGLAAALQTIIEIGERELLDETIADAFPGSHLTIQADASSRFSIQFHQHGLLRPLNQSELSDGTLRFLLLIAALLSPRPPSLLVLNEPETSLHPDLLPALANLIKKVSERTQVWVVSHSSRLVAALNEHPECNGLHLEKELGQTLIQGQGLLDQPAWHWPDK